MADFEIDDDRSRVDRDVLWEFLSTKAYWGRFRDRAKVERQLEAAWRVVAAYRSADGAMIGFARAMSDGEASAYLADVFVVEEARGAGVGKALVHAMIEEGPGPHLRWMLHTLDAHELYRPFGFAEPDATFMERRGRAAEVFGHHGAGPGS
ncbi:GNAT family N-acetyltransferase [Actinophytocola oryzae]|uniref:Acetyltransferase (GNAT) family protein n=1 Tax=Actinophytocola oryzae TaxID=502181 RepID=A0A4R7VXS7_9PSEU|nr:GNAT family N-acetyltransferase [Actinophytocola oryzae]TDV54792.1 acetyltransferase (GNAT) family protein [Actinophytocola oryzae]